MGAIQSMRRFLGYDAVTDKHRRKAPKSVVKTEDWELLSSDRKKLVATTKDLYRNSSIVQWAVNKHLDYVSRFSFVAQTGIEELDDALEAAFQRWERKCDITGRFTLREMLRMHEAGQVIDGDSAILKIKGGYLQGVEGNRIAKPNSGLPGEYSKTITEHGLVISEVGKVIKYCVCDRDGVGNLKFASMVPADDVVFNGYIRRFDQLRGVSPLASALNTFQDLYEAFEFQLVKAKMHAMFGVAIYSDAATTAGGGFGDTDYDTGDTPTAATSKYEFELRPGLKLELDKGDKIETVESRTPSAEFREYSELMLRCALLSLDIPYSFLFSDSPSFSGAKSVWASYEASNRWKREKNQNDLMKIADWIVPILCATDAELSSAARSARLKPEQLSYSFMAEGAPWIDEAAEVTSALNRINGGLSSWTRECKRRGERFKDITEERGNEIKLMSAMGAPASVSQPGQQQVASIEKPESDDAEEERTINENPQEKSGLDRWLS